ncbi:hypothetical protein A2X44_04285 [candidate division CPR3 bacterium GWF2_35_18]|uniref:5'-nucleotidase n=1 Tax=candidate division CPR3 bacterium GW2011_GWF2_35_18 TaxID=1618350 RepID=A0A0G0EPV2_UNCC3|nr:MAG: 5'-nucleotidase SurE [candidate division CPR3 bacterium GW2011_GWF2_35_18]KKP86953.1 MAG: 5'-nucleotidase SurE [candidate division CPR3 bacterium GW2011_GWE2_35_7]OGB62573.1 MAG: hypothetical protein A2X44_04285 [candidate division CPR3 bacterium GWF2_35_18]OGB65824.1 MAG: hypothetical protein A2250_01535 [candidate division CPR3 bacterium RIFOXYA2_FULL_35_13]OGB77353.1 MAG: hypothetical protein A2476_04035 [candidate division CPR3 bacterium RIFOXYC2_FULL_35_7]OGB79203.1 MAG: hypotheti
MEVKNILLTGDDGYNSLGTRVLARLLKDKYNLIIAATKTQQSGVGGKLTFLASHSWGEEVVEGVKAFWVDGTPADTMEFAQGYFKNKFDLIISGINWGENIAYANISSGTVAAAIRGLSVQLSEKAICLSYKRNNSNDWLRNHSLEDGFQEFLKYPGEMASKVIDDCIAKNLYEAKLINVNFPHEATTQVKFTKVSGNSTKYWHYPVIIDHKTHTFIYNKEVYASKIERELDEKLDTGALNKGYISISLMKGIFGDEGIF